jgi:nucleotide-binding universal stress UspA family protein
MFTHLLVPLDGSDLAESVLPAAVHLARATGARLTLLHVLEHNPPEEVHGQRHITTVEEGLRYLAATAATLPNGVAADVHVHPNQEHNIPRSIAAHAQEFGVDLILICTHGRSSLRRWLFGSIAQQVIALGDTPVLVIYPSPLPQGQGFACRKILTPLDGDPDHEAGLFAALDLAQACAAGLHLVAVVPTRSTLSGKGSASALLLPATTAALLDLSRQAAAEYLQRQAAKAVARGIAVTTEVQRGEPAATITAAAKAVHADLIVMATHGKTHTDAFWSGSVTPRVSSKTRRPLLLVPVAEGKPGDSAQS